MARRSAVANGIPDASGEPSASVVAVTQAHGQVGAEDQTASRDRSSDGRVGSERRVEHLGSRLGVVAGVGEGGGCHDRALEPAGIAGSWRGLLSDGLTDADVVATGVDDDELPDAIGHVAQGAEARDPTHRHPAERGPESGREGLVQCVDVGHKDVAGAVRVRRIEALEDEELELDAAPHDDGKRVRPLLAVRDLEPERLVEGERVIDGSGGQDGNRAFGHRSSLIGSRTFPPVAANGLVSGAPCKLGLETDTDRRTSSS